MKYFLLSIGIVLHISIYAQHNFVARILSKKDSTAIINASIKIIETKEHATSDNYGNFNFQNLNKSSYLIKISHISFNDTIIKLYIPCTKPCTIYLSDKAIQINEITITAARQEKKLEDIPARIDLINSEELENYPNTDFDNILQSISNVYVNRSWGIFSKNSSITMRGMDGTSRVLVLLDGVPINLSAGGGINWHMIGQSEVERVEVLKGPSLALYGNNAMGGVINIITKKGQNNFNIESSLFTGTYNTVGGKLNLGLNRIANSKGYYFSGEGFFRQGDGYIITPKAERDSTDAKIGLEEVNLNLKAGYQLNPDQKLDFRLQYYDDLRDEGIKIYEKKGSYLKYTTQLYQGSYTGKIEKFNIFLKTFYQRQDYYQHSERLNETGDSYKLYDRNQISKDYGVWLNLSHSFNNNFEISFGADYKHGNMIAEDIYFTSTDYSKRGGDIDYFAIFAQNELKLLNYKIRINIGLRADLAKFTNGFLYVEDPTSVTSFESQKSEIFASTNWTNISPKIAFQYKFSPEIRAYLSYSTGFMPPKLDDMVSSRKVNKGFKIANPHLKPETLNNYEIGADYIPSGKLKFELSSYYSIGTDFQYFAHTGDTVDIDKPVLIRDNIGKARIIGFEGSMELKFAKYFSLKTNYTYNNSKIVEFATTSDYSSDNLTGKFISETPPHQAYTGINFNNGDLALSFVANYISFMWADEYNIEKLDAYTIFDIRFLKKIKQFKLIFDIQNIFDNQYIDKKNGLSPGRFIMFEINYHISIKKTNKSSTN